MSIHLKNIVIICPHDTSLPLQVTSYRAFMPRYGMLAVAAALKNAGCNVRTFCELSGGRVDWDATLNADAVCFSLMSFMAAKGYGYADRIKQERPGMPIVFGGSHASVLPEDCLSHCDYVVRNEGEAAIVELLKCLEKKGDVSGIKGLSYKDPAGNPVHNPNRDFIQELTCVADPSLVEGYTARTPWFYIKDAFRNGIPRFNIAVVQASRGCPSKCRFCFVRQELGGKYRMRDPELVLREVELSVRKLRTRYVFFADNDFTLDRNHALEILNLLAERFGGDLDLFFFSRIFISKDQELMRAIERAGRACIGVGVESLESDTLNYFEKKQSLDDINQCLDLFSRYNVKLQLLFVFGSDTDTVESIHKALNLALEHKVYNWGFCSLYDFPTKEKILGFPQSLPDHRFIHRDWRFYSGNFVVHYPRTMPPSVLQKEMSAAYIKFYTSNKNSFYQYHPIQAAYKFYVPMLEKLETGLYDQNGMLDEEKLPGPAAMQKRIDIGFRRSALTRECIRFYRGNIFRPQSWKFLLSLLRSAPGS